MNIKPVVIALALVSALCAAACEQTKPPLTPDTAESNVVPDGGTADMAEPVIPKTSSPK